MILLGGVLSSSAQLEGHSVSKATALFRRRYNHQQRPLTDPLIGHWVSEGSRYSSTLSTTSRLTNRQHIFTLSFIAYDTAEAKGQGCWEQELMGTAEGSSVHTHVHARGLLSYAQGAI